MGAGLVGALHTHSPTHSGSRQLKVRYMQVLPSLPQLYSGRFSNGKITAKNHTICVGLFSSHISWDWVSVFTCWTSLPFLHLPSLYISKIQSLYQRYHLHESYRCSCTWIHTIWNHSGCNYSCRYFRPHVCEWILKCHLDQNYFLRIINHRWSHLGIDLYKEKNHPIWNTAILCFTFIMIGYSSFAQIIIVQLPTLLWMKIIRRMFSILFPTLKREQYGERPLFIGQYYNARSLIRWPVMIHGQKLKEREKICERSFRKWNLYMRQTKQPYSRMWSNQQSHINEYKNGRDVKVTALQPWRKSEILFVYQMGEMYWRYFMGISSAARMIYKDRAVSRKETGSAE